MTNAQPEPEHRRILAAYERLAERLSGGGFFEFRDAAHVCRLHERYLATLRLLRAHGYHPLGPLRLLDVGCGDGNMLRQFLDWGAAPERLAGIELREGPVATARRLLPQVDVRVGSATALPWADRSFDLVCQHTVFTSVLDDGWRRQIAAELARVLRPGGAVLWYDFAFDNPANPDVRGIQPGAVRALFPGYTPHLARITLAPPVARRLPEALLPVAYPLLAALPLLRTHVLGLLVKP
jgi:SAM-dependent methyltransferase